jgi:hypothetical protein
VTVCAGVSADVALPRAAGGGVVANCGSVQLLVQVPSAWIS